ncbi:PhzF family phenazine biosynthesis protein [Streptomyces sp. NPDC050085]|uniref:PhzF family phenazine biosynthesis protein n=1 Tax=Streptomyces sp. NPDC050085 TaxID=3365600 RepID=UPI0037B64E34
MWGGHRHPVFPRRVKCEGHLAATGDHNWPLTDGNSSPVRHGRFGGRGGTARPQLPVLGQIVGSCRINVFAGHDETFTTRMFSPFDVAAPEDPACGSAAGPLAAHLVRYGRVASGPQITLSQGAWAGRLRFSPSRAVTLSGSPRSSSVAASGSSAAENLPFRLPPSHRLGQHTR